MSGTLKEMVKCAIIQRVLIKKYGGYVVATKIVNVIAGNLQ